MSDTLPGTDHPLFAQVKSIIEDHLGVDAIKIEPEAMFSDDFGADSVDQVVLVMAFEETFGVEIADVDAERCFRVGDAIALLDRLGAKPLPSKAEGCRSDRPSGATE